MSGGVFAVDRGIFDHPIFAPEPYTEREAWLWMLSAAAWVAKRVRVGKAVFDLKRGQLAFATRFLATKWKWGHSKVVRFLNRLKIDTMIDTLPTREATLITVCNYDQYQFGGNGSETQTGTPTETEVKRNRNKEEETNNLITKDSCAVAKATRPKHDYSKEFEEAWQAYPKRDGGNPKSPAAKRFLSAVKAGDDPQSIIGGIRRFAVAERRNVGTPFIPQMVKWLNDRRWIDYGPDCSIVKFDIRGSII